MDVRGQLSYCLLFFPIMSTVLLSFSFTGDNLIWIPSFVLVLFRDLLSFERDLIIRVMKPFQIMNIQLNSIRRYDIAVSQ